ncbi:helix-turn-helix domain-containing protein [Paremcibacter congregatus]|uniref:Transcriptional regulator n=1 Tax=Paremcibacter congregatus TaxID=2043170 RepID=A0A2G4YS34_9PROT|nr:helix-turn-helix transcriptional regulator [Paremcibacter congregatus]PHZ85080.1 transcriptional regulator [Paremcibacter congregatus]QDE27970.1 helix-turn-helix transcriptional regulator [Paremcibacter congregatus]
MITGMQVRLGRTALRLSVRDLATKTGLTANTINRFENGSDAKGSTIQKLQSYLETSGVEFIAENGGGVGVRLKK